MDHRLFKRVSAASATQFVPPPPPPSLSLSIYSVCLSLPLISMSFSHSLVIQLSPPEVSAFPFLSLLSSLLIFALTLPPPPPSPPPSPSLLLDACLHEGCRLEPQVDWEAQTLEQNLKLTTCFWMRVSLQHLTGTSTTLSLPSVFLSPWSNWFFCSWTFFFFRFNF